MGVFDGVALGGICGSGMFIYLSLDEYYSFKWCSGQGKNSRVDLLALWGILFCVNWMKIKEIGIFCYYRVIID